MHCHTCSGQWVLILWDRGIIIVKN
jgi:hypothetical protein